MFETVVASRSDRMFEKIRMRLGELTTANGHEKEGCDCGFMCWKKYILVKHHVLYIASVNGRTRPALSLGRRA